MNIIKFSTFFKCALCLTLFMLHFTAPAQEVNCIDLSDLHAPYIHCTSGHFTNPYQVVGVDNGCHKVITEQGKDPNTGNELDLIPEGANYSIKLGNQASEAHAESITCDIAIDTNDFDILILKYAAVLQDPHHPAGSQPQFTFAILDMQDEPIDTLCLSAVFVADSSLGWHKYHNILWKDWTSVGVDLSEFHGETIKVRMTTYDCLEGGHFGYAYFTLECERKRIENIICGLSNEYIYSAPSGFSYRWFWQDAPQQILSNQQTVSVDIGDGSRTLQCHLSFIENPSCGFDLYTEAKLLAPVSQFEIFQINCTKSYTFLNQSFISYDGIHPDGSGEPCHDVLWDFGDGETSTETSPTHSFLPGNHTITMITGLFGFQCTDTLTQTLHVIADTTINITTCDSYSWNEVFYTESGTFVQSIPTQQDCDSIVTMILDLEYSPDFTIEGNHWVIGGSETHWNSETYQINIIDPKSHIDSITWSIDCPNWQAIPTEDGLQCELHIHTYLLPIDSVALHAKIYNRCGIAEQTFWIHTTYYGIDETETKPVALTVFPNPNHGSFSLSIKGLWGEVDMKIYDSKGTLVKQWTGQHSAESETIELDMSGHPEGIYLLLINNGMHSWTKRIVILK